MKKKLLLILFVATTISFAQEKNEELILDTGIPPKKNIYYTDSGYFKDGLAAIMTSEGKWGFINKKGDLVIPAKYDGSEHLSFDKGACLVNIGRELFLLDKKGSELTPNGYTLQSTLDGNFAIITKDGKSGLMNSSGKIIVPVGVYTDFMHSNRSSFIFVLQDEKHGMINFNGDQIITPKYLQLFSGTFKEGDVFTAMLDNKNGFIDNKGHEIIAFKYNNARYFSEGFCAVKLGNKFGFINKEDKEIIPFKYENVRDFAEGLASVSINGKWGMINTEDQLIIPAIYDNIHSFHDGLLVVQYSRKYGIVDNKGKIIVPSEYDYIIESELEYEGKTKEDNVFIVRKNNKVGLVNSKGEFIAAVIYDNLFSLPYNRTILVQNHKFGLINNTTGKVLVDFKYDFMKPEITENCIIVGNDSGQGFINLDGKEIIPLKYRSAKKFSEGLAAVVNDSGRIVYINKKNKVVIQPRFPGQEEEIYIKY